MDTEPRNIERQGNEEHISDSSLDNTTSLPFKCC